MSPSEGRILHVSDTALMVAACRALETAHPIGIIRDPFAERLAGERGMAIARALPGLEILRFGVGVRSRFLDELVAFAVAEYAIDTVVSAGCGLDTRPWRLDLPPRLRWIEVDFPAMLEYKDAVMASVRPKCRLERMAADLNDQAQRHAVFSAAGDGPGLIVTEGLLMYLPAENVEALAAEAGAMSGIRYWMLDATSPELDRRMEVHSRNAFDHVRAENHLDGVQILEVLRRNGWTTVRHRSYTRDSMKVAGERIRAMMVARAANPALQPPPPPADDPSGVYLVGRG
jgi:methyltransferase (TIGR00027 family)